MKICLVCSSGGHFMQVYSLRALWEKYDHFWVTFNKQDTAHLLNGEEVYYAFMPTNRNIKNFIRNLFLAFRILTKNRPEVVISIGAGVGVPFLYAAKLLKIRTIFIETLSRINDLSLSGKLVYPVADHFIVQWPELAGRYKKAVYKGQIV